MIWLDNALARAILLASAMAATLVGLRSFPNGSRRLPACQTILNAIGNLLADGCQFEEFLFADIFRFFGKLPIYRRTRAGDNHPNPCMPLCVSPSPDGPGR